MSIDVIGNFLTIIRNGVSASKRTVVAPYSKVKENIAHVLHREGFIRAYEVINADDVATKALKITLAYKNGESVLHSIERTSTPGSRVYRRLRTLKPVIGGLGISILTTSRGIITDKEARQYGVSGEVICTVW